MDDADESVPVSDLNQLNRTLRHHPHFTSRVDTVTRSSQIFSRSGGHHGGDPRSSRFDPALHDPEGSGRPTFIEQEADQPALRIKIDRARIRTL
jgi:hypothetical protein